MNWHEYPILRILLAFISGILIQNWVKIQINPYLFSALILLLLLLLVFQYSKKANYAKRYIRGVFISFAFIGLGILVPQIQKPFDKPDYYGNFIEGADMFEAIITEAPIETEKSLKLVVDITRVYFSSQERLCSGKAILYLQKDSSALDLVYGGRVLLSNSLEVIRQQGNPKAFDYKRYMLLQGVKHQAFLRSNDWRLLSVNKAKGIVFYSLKARNLLLNLLQNNGLEGDEYAVAAALLLGQRDYLSVDMQQTYAGVGAMHVLCVSGLHVGMIFLVLSRIFKFLDRKRNGRIIRLIIILSTLWFYAFITGLSPSVLRATTMFSFVSVGANLNRKVHIYNSLSISALTLLVVDPNLLFQLGFQLSYAAVWAIVAFQPALYKLWIPKNKTLDYIWALATVSIAAQIGTAPLSIYYFHSFPTYFLLTNILVIPAAWLIIHLGFLSLILSIIPLLGSLLGYLLAWLIKALNFLMVGVADFPYSVTTEIAMNTLQMLLWYILILSVGIWLFQKKRLLIYFNLVLLIVLAVSGIILESQTARQKEFLIYQTNKGLAMSAIWADKHYLIGDSIIYDQKARSYAMDNYLVSKNIDHHHMIHVYESEEQSPIQFPFIEFMGKRFVVLDDSLAKMKLTETLKIDYLIMASTRAKKPKVFLNYYNPEEVIIHSKVYSNVKQVWKRELDSLGIRYFDIKEEGAFHLKEREAIQFLTLF